MNDSNYIQQRLMALSTGTNDLQKELDALKAENAQLREQIESMPATEFRSDAQTDFEKSQEFEQILNVFFLRWVRSKFSAEFRTSPHMKDFQSAANAAFAQFEKNYRKEQTKHGQNSQKDSAQD